jgi:2-phospho-L-lactate guanylyltransferase
MHGPEPGRHPDPKAARVVAIVPIGSLDAAKSRLGAVLDAEERRDLVTRLARSTIGALSRTPGVAETIVITPDDEVRELALVEGARPMRQRTRGLNAAIREARDDAIAGGASAILVVPIDLPRATPDAITTVVAAAARATGPLVLIVPDRHGRGTNALYLAPPDVIDPQFGGDSRDAHVAAARNAGATLIEVGGPLTVDLDTPDDLLLAETTVDEPVDPTDVRETVGG